MRKLALLLIVTTTLLNAQNLTPTSNPERWSLIPSISDEFNNSSLNTNLWRDWNPAESRFRGEVYFGPSNVQFGLSGDGSCNVVKLITRKEVITADNGWGTSTKTFYLTAGTLVSKLHFKYGYYEIRAKLPSRIDDSAQALWMWMEDNINGYREIDISESVSNKPNNSPFSLHYGVPPCNSGYDYNGIEDLGLTPYNLAESFITFGLDWQPNYITLYINNKLFRSYVQIFKSSGASSCSTTPTLSVSAFNGWMWLVLWNFVIDSELGTAYPGATGDIYEIDYFRYYKLAPKIDMVAYDCSTGVVTYDATTNNLDQISFSYDVSKVDLISLQSITNGKRIQLKIKPGFESQDILLTATAQNYLEREDPNTQINISSSSQILLKQHNSDFYISPTYFNNNQLLIQAFAYSVNTNSEWSVGKKNSNGTIDWTNPQTQFGISATFGNLIPGQVYVIKHGEYGPCSPWVEKRKEFTANYDAEFTYVKNWVNNQLSLVATTSITGVPDKWELAKKNANGSLDWSAPQTQYNSTANFTNLLPGTYYIIKHTKYTSVGSTVVQKTIFVDYNSDFEIKGLSCGDKLNLNYINGVLSLRAISNELGHGSEWYLHAVDGSGNMSTLLQGPIWGDNVILNQGLAIGSTYIIKHGSFNSSGYWTETKKIVKLTSDKICPTMTFQINELPTTSGQIIETGLISIFPNPSDGVFTLKSEVELMNIPYELYDLSGKIALRGIIQGNMSRIDCSNLQNGTYVLKINRNQAPSYIHKVQIIR